MQVRTRMRQLRIPYSEIRVYTVCRSSSPAAAASARAGVGFEVDRCGSRCTQKTTPSRSGVACACTEEPAASRDTHAAPHGIGLPARSGRPCGACRCRCYPRIRLGRVVARKPLCRKQKQGGGSAWVCACAGMVATLRHATRWHRILCHSSWHAVAPRHCAGTGTAAWSSGSRRIDLPPLH